MILSAAELVAAKEATGALLDELGLSNYLFEVEPQGNVWRIKVDCATKGGWQSLALTVGKQTLLQSQTDSAARSHLMGVFRQRLSARKPRARKRS